MTKDHLLSDINWFRNHLENKTTRRVMAAEAGVSPATIAYWLRKHGFEIKKQTINRGRVKTVRFKSHKREPGEIDTLDVYKYGFDVDDVEEIKSKLSDRAAKVFESCYECAKDNDIMTKSYFQWLRNGINHKRRCLILNEIRNVIAEHVGLSLCN